MPENIESSELKTGLSEILDRVREGEAFTVTERGEPVAQLLPCRSREKIASAIRDIKAGMRKMPVSDDLLKEYMEWGRK